MKVRILIPSSNIKVSEENQCFRKHNIDFQTEAAIFVHFYARFLRCLNSVFSGVILKMFLLHVSDDDYHFWSFHNDGFFHKVILVL